MQAKFLHFLQSKEFTRLGESKVRKVDARILAATNRNLERAVEEGVFRQDLYYRLNVVEITLPPLRERVEDIEILAELYFKRFVRENRRALKGISPTVMALLNAYSWPGNVRELVNAMQRATIVARGEYLEPGDLPPHIATYRPRPTRPRSWPASPTWSGNTSARSWPTPAPWRRPPRYWGSTPPPSGANARKPLE